MVLYLYFLILYKSLTHLAYSREALQHHPFTETRRLNHSATSVTPPFTQTCPAALDISIPPSNDVTPFPSSNQAPTLTCFGQPKHYHRPVLHMFRVIALSVASACICSCHGFFISSLNMSG